MSEKNNHFYSSHQLLFDIYFHNIVRCMGWTKCSWSESRSARSSSQVDIMQEDVRKEWNWIYFNG